MKAGATGKYPDGKLGQNDEGELVIAISLLDGNHIRIEFGKSITWMAMNRNEAVGFTQALMNAIHILDRGMF